MNFKRYFKTNQQLVLQHRSPDSSATGRTELLVVTVTGVEENRMTVNSPHGSDIIDHYAITSDKTIEITTDVMGMGAKITGHFEKKISPTEFSLLLNHDMSLFQRRVKDRRDCELGIRFSRGAKTLAAMREVWEKNLKFLYNEETPTSFQGFRPCRVNISAGGIRFAMKPPPNQGDICLILIRLEDGKPPVCAIAEVVWSSIIDPEAATTGMRFINILTEDQDRINSFVINKK